MSLHGNLLGPEPTRLPADPAVAALAAGAHALQAAPAHPPTAPAPGRRRLDRHTLLVVAELAYLPPDPQAATLLSALVARRYEQGSIIVTSNRGFEAWGEILGDAMVAAALIDRLVHHATMITLKGKSYRLRERGAGIPPAAQAPSLRDSA